jgi:putative hemolysin
MMAVLLYFGAIIVIYYFGYIFAMHSLAAYLASDDIENNKERLSRFSRRYLEDAVANPRLTLQMTIIFKSFTIIVTSFLAILLAQILIARYDFNPTFVFLIALLIIWSFYLFFMEYLPRMRALRHSDRSVLKYIPLFALLYRIFKPFLWLYARVFNLRPQSVSEEQKEEIIERAIESLADRAGVSEPIVEEEEREMIGQIFQLDMTEVREVMVHRTEIKGLRFDSKLDDIRQLTSTEGFSRYPVYRENLDNIIGILYVKDLFTRLPLPVDESRFDIVNYMRPAYFVPESKKINVLLSEFKTKKIHIAVVVDEYGGTSGIITLEDILEEIVGDIQDEHDFETDDIQKMADNSMLVDAALSVEELAEELNLDYDSDKFETIGGLIYDLVGSVPSVGTRLKWNNVIFEVDKVEGQRIMSVRVWSKKGPDK